MREDKKDSFNNLNYQPVCRASDYFDNLAEKEKLEIKKRPSLSSLFSLILNKIYSNLLKFIESIIGVRLYASVDEPLLQGISPKMKRLVVGFFQKKIIKQITKLPRLYYDEPQIIEYQIEIPTVLPDISLYSDGQGSFVRYGGGADLDEEEAFIKTVGEGLERFCLCVYREKNLFLSSYEKISQKALNPLSFAGISPFRHQTSPKLKIDKKSVFRWVKGFSLFNKKRVLIPAQLIYIGYKYHPQEPMIQEQISTGAAAADSFEEALYKGICEAVERDALMITYFNKLSPPQIELEEIEDEEIQRLLVMFKRYNLELYIIDMTTDIAIPSIMAIIIDRTGVGSVVNMGCKTSLDIKEAILGAAFEALRGRIGFRKMLPPTDEFLKRQKLLKSNPSQIRTFDDRFLFWNSLDMIKKIEFLFQGSKKKFSSEELNRYKNTSVNALVKGKLKTTLKILEERKIDVYGVDITLPQIKEEGIYVAKVVSPQLQPLYLDEGIRHCWGERLFNVPVKLGYRDKPLSEEELNPLPHPFL